MSIRDWRVMVIAPILHLCVGQAGAVTVADLLVTPEPVAGPPAEDASTWGAAYLPQFLQDLGFVSWSEIMRPGSWAGGIGLSASTEGQTVRSPDAPSQRFSSTLFKEFVALRNEDFVLFDRRLMTGTAGVVLGLQQMRQDALGAHTSQHQSLVGYALELGFLSDTAYRSNFFANQSQATNNLASGGTNDVEITNRGIILRWGENSILRDREILPFFSATMQARQERDKQVTTVSGQAFRREDQRDSIGLEGHNGTETSDLNFKFQYSRVKDFLYEANSYTYRTASAYYSLDFGSGFNRKWDSWIDLYERNGTTPFSNLSLNEVLTIDHYDNLATTYNYAFTRQAMAENSVTAQSGGVLLQHQLWGNLNTLAGLSGFRQSVPQGTIESGMAQLNFNYNHRLPWSGQFSATLGGSYALSSSQVPGGVVPVVDAPYRAPSSFGAGAGFFLKDPFIVVDSISIVDVKNGARIQTQVGVDYNVVVDGSRTKIEPLPTSTIILPGDLLEVSYVYEVVPNLKYATGTSSFSVGANWDWLSIDFSHDQSNVENISGTASQLVGDTRRDNLRISGNGSWAAFQARVDASALHYEGPTLAYDSVTLYENLSYTPNPIFNMAFSANQYRTNFKLPPHETKGRSARLDVSLNWNDWQASAYAAMRSFSDTLEPTEKIQEAGLRLSRRWLKLNVAMSAYGYKRTRAGVQTNSGNAQITVARQF